MDKKTLHSISDNLKDDLASCDDFKDETQKRKNIDIAHSIERRLRILAAFHERDFKNFMQDVLTDYAMKNLPKL